MKGFVRWGGAALFLLSLLSFAAIYTFRLRTPAPIPDSGEALRDAIANVILFTVFALHHSLMARTGAKAWLTKIVPPDLERSVYVWIASLLFLAVCWMWQALPGMVWQIRGPGFALYVAQFFGVVLSVAATRVVGARELAGVRQPDPAKPVEFSATGPFSLVRHPIYLGWILIVFAMPAMSTSQLLFAVVSTTYIVVAIPFEERTLLEAYGEKYAAYQRQMRWRLIPGVW